MSTMFGFGLAACIDGNVHMHASTQSVIVAMVCGGEGGVYRCGVRVLVIDL